MGLGSQDSILSKRKYSSVTSCSVLEALTSLLVMKIDEVSWSMRCQEKGTNQTSLKVLEEHKILKWTQARISKQMKWKERISLFEQRTFAQIFTMTQIIATWRSATSNRAGGKKKSLFLSWAQDFRHDLFWIEIWLCKVDIHMSWIITCEGKKRAGDKWQQLLWNGKPEVVGLHIRPSSSCLMRTFHDETTLTSRRLCIGFQHSSLSTKLSNKQSSEKRPRFFFVGNSNIGLTQHGCDIGNKRGPVFWQIH